MLSSTNAKNSLIEVSPLLILSTHSPLSSSRDSKMSSTTLFPTLRCLPGRGLIFHCSRKSYFGYLERGMLTTLYHQLSLCLSHLPCKNSRPISPQMASFEVFSSINSLHALLIITQVSIHQRGF